jgi:hypothetical protein
MNETTNLHWSFNHDRTGQSPDFAQQLRSLIKGTLETTASGDHGDEVTHYTILPNFRSGYKGQAGGNDLSVGEVVIRRTVESENRLNYSVVYRNAASGELMDMQFVSNRDAFRTLTGSWSVQVENCAGDGYKEFSCDGRLEEDGSVFLVTNELDLRAGSADLSVPLTCNWALFDVIPALAEGLRDSGEVQRLTILEDLEKVRNNGQVRFLESYDLQLDSDSVALTGYALIAEGMTPSYWWLDARGRVLIAATLYQTLILTGGENA